MEMDCNVGMKCYVNLLIQKPAIGICTPELDYFKLCSLEAISILNLDH